MRGYRSEDRHRAEPRYKAQPPVRIDGVTCTMVTDKAARVRVRNREYWVPQSAIHADSEVWKRGDSGTLVVAHWWAARNQFCQAKQTTSR